MESVAQGRPAGACAFPQTTGVQARAQPRCVYPEMRQARSLPPSDSQVHCDGDLFLHRAINLVFFFSKK